jgi:hypothetical protein
MVSINSNRSTVQPAISAAALRTIRCAIVYDVRHFDGVQRVVIVTAT